MGKYDDWKRGEDEALLNIVGGLEVARAILRGEYRLIVEQVVRQKQTAVVLSPLVGNIVKTVHLKPYQTSSVAEAIKLGKYNGVDEVIVSDFAGEEVGITKAVSVNFVEFDRDPNEEEIIVWANGKKPIQAKHILAIGSQHPEEQRVRPIVGLGSVQSGHVLYLDGSSDWRYLDRITLAARWSRGCLFGFLSE
ncbi:MAG: hypothetical protein Q7S24_00035 [bacterium]|nr:hypothetical protein [bacterium]